jgi:hypothetical protein
MKKKKIYFILLILIFIVSCEKKTTEIEDWDPNGSWAGSISDGNNSGNFETFSIISANVYASSSITYSQGFEFYEETIILGGNIVENGDVFDLTCSFTISIIDGNGSQVYYSNGTTSGELYYDDDMPFPEGFGSGSTVDNQRTISWDIFKTQ